MWSFIINYIVPRNCQGENCWCFNLEWQFCFIYTLIQHNLLHYFLTTMIKFKLFKPWKKMSGYIGDILCVGGCQHDIAWRFIEGEKYRKILPIKLKNRLIWWKIVNFSATFGDKSSIFWPFFVVSFRVIQQPRSHRPPTPLTIMHLMP